MKKVVAGLLAMVAVGAIAACKPVEGGGSTVRGDRSTSQQAPGVAEPESTTERRTADGQPHVDMSRMKGPYHVVRAVDGDTLAVEVDRRTVTVRVIGLDTPETVKPNTPVQPCGKQAARMTARLTEGQRVWLEADPSQQSVDKYGRTLAHVWTVYPTSGQPKELLSLRLISEGLGKEYTFAGRDYRYKEYLVAAQDTARSAGRCVWRH